MSSSSLTVFSIFGITLVVSLLGIIGGLFLLLNERFARKWSSYLVSFAAGSILGAAFLDLFPEAIEHAEGEMMSLMIPLLAGILVFLILEKVLVWHHHLHSDHGDLPEESQRLVAARPLIILGDALHNFLDGIIVAVAFLTDFSLGIVTSAAVVAHELPQEIGDFGVLLHSGMKKSRVLMWNVLGALLGPLGALLGYFAHESLSGVEDWLLPFAIGNFLYIALADLIPSLHHERRLWRNFLQVAFVILGIFVIWQIGAALPHA